MLRPLCLCLCLPLFLCSPGWANDTNPPKEDPGTTKLYEETRKEVQALRRELDELRAGPVEAPEDEIPRLSDVLLENTRVRGALRGGYGWNLAAPDQRKGANDLRLSDPDHNTFALTHALLGVERRISPDAIWGVGYGLDVVAGRVVEEAYDDGLLQSRGLAVGQAYVDLKLPLFGGTTIGAGKRYGWFGLESIDLSRNFHQSLSYAALSAPRTVTGLSVDFELADGLSYTQYVVNGWDQAIDENDAKSLGGSLRLERGDFRARLNWIAGAERADSEADLRWLLEVAVDYSLDDATRFELLLRYGQEEFGDQTEDFALVQAGVRREFFDGSVRMGLRVTFLHDEDGLITGREQSLLEATATAEWRPLDAVGLGVEYRHDHSSEADAFRGSRGQATRRGQDTVAFFLRFDF